MKMEEEKYLNLFKAFEKAPMEEFLKTIMDEVSPEEQKGLILEDVSFHRYNADVVSLEVWMCLAPVESNQWIWVRVEMDTASGDIKEYYCTKDSYSRQSLSSLKACMECYRKTEQ